jgi:hypothetical protein
VLFGCKKDNNSDCPLFTGLQVPNSLIFIIKKNGIRLDDSLLNLSRLFYLKNNQRVYVNDFSRGVNEGGFNAYDLGILASRDVGLISGNESIKDFYLELPNSDIDTLFVDYRHYSQCEADTSACYCLYPRLQVKYNGQVATYDPTITQQQVYLFNKQ